MRKVLLWVLFILLLSALSPAQSCGSPAEDVQLVTNDQYFQMAQKLIKEAKKSIQVMMFEMAYYEEHSNSPSNVLIREMISARKRGVKVEVVLEVRDDEDRTTKRNRQSGKVLSEGGVEVVYDPSFKTTHAKMMIVDGHLVLLGSTNWTYHALADNNEVSLLIRSKEVARELIEYFHRVKSTGSKS